MSATPRIAIVGGGVVGSALGRALVQAGYVVVMVASRTRGSAEAAAAFIHGGADGPAPIVTTHAERAVGVADLVLCAVPDDAVAGVATTLASGELGDPPPLVVHCAGALAADVLAPVEDRGAAIGSLHPLQAFASAAEAVALLPGTVFGIEGNANVQARLATLVADLGGRTLPIRPGTKPLYHAAAAVISNYTTTLAGAAVELMTAAGADPATALDALLPLLEGTVRNLRTVGLPQALTGPIARGDVATVRAHLEALDATAPQLRSLYAACGRRTMQLARAKGTLSDADADVLATLLARGES